METEIYDALKEKLGDAKIKIGEDEKGLLDVVADWEEGVVKTRAANKDLTTQREAWEKKERDFKSAAESLESAKNELKTQIEDLQKKGSGKKEEKAEWEKQVNALTEQINELKGKAEQAEVNAKTMEEKANKANETASVKNLREEILKELANNKITGSRADTAIDSILAKGFAKIMKNEETGLWEQSFCTKKDGKLLAADLKTACKWFADTNQYLVEGSGKPGTGNNHNSSKPANNDMSPADMLSIGR